MAMPSVMKNKTLSSKKGKTMPNEGPSGKMMKQQHTGAQTPGVSSQEKKPIGGIGAKGGSTKMFGKSGSNPKKPGTTSAR